MRYNQSPKTNTTGWKLTVGSERRRLDDTRLAVAALETWWWDDHELPVVWLFVFTEDVFEFSALQILIWLTRTMTITVTVSALVFPSASIIGHKSWLAGGRALKGEVLPLLILKGEELAWLSWRSPFHSPVLPFFFLFFLTHSGFVFPTMCY